MGSVDERIMCEASVDYTNANQNKKPLRLVQPVMLAFWKLGSIDACSRAARAPLRSKLT